MASCNHMCFHSCKGSHEPFFNLSLTQQGCPNTISALLLPFLVMTDPQLCLQSSISWIDWVVSSKATSGSYTSRNSAWHRFKNHFPLWKICHSLCICAVNSPVSRDGCSCLPSASRHALLAKDLVTWQSMVGRHILEDIVGRVAQYVDEHYPVDKWHLGDLIAWVAQSALKYRPRICELSKCLEGPLKR
ncbi:hypothetical protein TNCV_2434731 [Trichonephila clavipes]|nr:hypothetical protein TNCV_2434731 [Trichonephila clavipes]